MGGVYRGGIPLRKLHKTEYIVQFKANSTLSQDPAELITQLLYYQIALGDMARQALGGNGHMPELAAQLIEELAKR